MAGEERKKITVQEFNLVSTWTRRTHVDSVVDIMTKDEENDCFFDYENDAELSLREGFYILSGAVAYPFEHEGFTPEESEILTNLFVEFGVDRDVLF